MSYLNGVHGSVFTSVSIAMHLFNIRLLTHEFMVGVSILTLFTIFLLESGTVPAVRYGLFFILSPIRTNNVK